MFFECRVKVREKHWMTSLLDKKWVKALSILVIGGIFNLTLTVVAF